jgi:AcrR family transcriptional regulator
MAPPRRTQEERREGTIRKLLDAAAGALIDDGYAAASVQAICERAGLSQGALFRHFPTREELMVAVGRDVGRQILARYRRDFEALRDDDDRLVSAMRLVRDRCRSRLNQAWYELATAARTSPSLRKGLKPVAAQYYADIHALAVQLLPEVAAAMGDGFPVLVDTILAVFDGESVRRFVLPGPQVDEARLELLAALAKAALGARRGGAVSSARERRD